MQYEIFGDNLPAVTINLEEGESIYTQSGGMSWMSEHVMMETNMKGGLLKSLGRMFSGESLFIATYKASQPNQSITVSSCVPGQILCFDITPENEIICQKNAFLCAQPGVELSVSVTKGFKSGMFGGEGFILQKLSGQGKAFLELDGSVKKLNLAPGETIKVDTGHIAAYEASVSYSSEMVKGFKNILFGGEGLFLATLKGPGAVYLQTITMDGFAKRILPFMPVQTAKHD